MVHQAIEQTTETGTQTWTYEEIAARKALWTAVVARLEAVMPTGAYDEMLAFQAAVEREAGCTYRELQAAISGQAGPAPLCVRDPEKRTVVLVTYGYFDGPSAEGGDVRGDDRCPPTPRPLALVA